MGEDECRAWPIPKGADAVMGASQIHTDLGKRFVRAEVVGYEDFKRVGSMKEAKSQGVYRLEGKTYIVQGTATSCTSCEGSGVRGQGSGVRGPGVKGQGKTRETARAERSRVSGPSASRCVRPAPLPPPLKSLLTRG